MTFNPNRCIERPPTAASNVYEATTRSCGHQSHARIHQFLLRIEDVERCALPDSRLFAYAIERNFGGIHLRRGGFDLRFGGVQLSPALHDGSTRLIAIDVKIETLLAERFLGLANGRIFGTALVDRYRKLAQNGDVRLSQYLRLRVVALRVASGKAEVGIKRALADFHREHSDVDAVHCR